MHTVAPSYSEFEGDCLLLRVLLTGRLAAVGFRVAVVFRAGAFLGVFGVGAGSVSVAIPLSWTAAPSVTSLDTTMVSGGVDSSTKGGVCSS
jgi:hypothetical protein